MTQDGLQVGDLITSLGLKKMPLKYSRAMKNRCLLNEEFHVVIKAGLVLVSSSVIVLLSALFFSLPSFITHLFISCPLFTTHFPFSQIKSGEKTFEELSSEFSDCSSAKRGGDLGPFGRGQMQKPFEDATFGLEVREGIHYVCEVIE